MFQDVSVYQACHLAGVLLALVALLALCGGCRPASGTGGGRRAGLVWCASVASGAMLLLSHMAYLGNSRGSLDWRGPLRYGVDLTAIGVVLTLFLVAAVCTRILSREGAPSRPVAAPGAALLSWVVLSQRAPVSPEAMLSVGIAGVALVLLLVRRGGASGAPSGWRAPGGRRVLRVLLVAAVAIVACGLGVTGAMLYELRTNRPASRGGEVDYEAFSPVVTKMDVVYVVLSVSSYERDGRVESADVSLAIDPGLEGHDLVPWGIEDEIRERYGIPEDASIAYALYDELCLTEVAPDEVGGETDPHISERYLMSYVF